MWGECIVLRAWSGAPKWGRLCVLEQEQSCGKNWGRVGTLLCSSQFEGKCVLNCAVDCKHLPINTHTHTRKHTHARSAETKTIRNLSSPCPVWSLSLPLTPSGTLHHLLLWQISSLFQFLGGVTASSGPVPFIVEVSGSHKEFSRRVISTSQRPLLENTQRSQQRVIHVLGGIRTRNPNKWTAADPRLRTRSHWHQAVTLIVMGNMAPVRRGLLTYKLTAWNRILIEKVTGSKLVKKFEVFFMEHKSSLPHSQQPATCPYREPPRSSPCPHIPILKIRLNFILPSMPWFLKWSLSLRIPN